MKSPDKPFEFEGEWRSHGEQRGRRDEAELSGCIRSLVETAIKGYLPVAVLLATEFSATSWQESDIARISISPLLSGQ